MGRGSRRSIQIQYKNDITEEAKVIRLQTSGRQYPSDDCKLPRYVMVETESTGFPWTRIDGGCGPEPTFWIFVFGHEIRRPNTAAASLKLLRQEDAWIGESTRKVVSSAYTRSVKCCWSTVILGRDVMCRRIQSMAMQKSDGARTHPCRTPEVVSRWPDNSSPTRTRTAVPSWSALIRSRRIAGTPLLRSTFQRARLSTESKAVFISRYIYDV